MSYREVHCTIHIDPPVEPVPLPSALDLLVEAWRNCRRRQVERAMRDRVETSILEQLEQLQRRQP